MRHTTTLPIHSSLSALFKALAAHIDVEFDGSAIDQVVAGSDEAVCLSKPGHVVVHMNVASEAGFGELQIDGNRRRIKVAREICGAWSSAFGSDPSTRELEQSQQIFAQALTDLDSQ